MKTHEIVVWTPLVGFEKNDPDRGVARFLALIMKNLMVLHCSCSVPILYISIPV